MKNVMSGRRRPVSSTSQTSSSCFSRGDIARQDRPILLPRFPGRDISAPATQRIYMPSSPSACGEKVCYSQGNNFMRSLKPTLFLVFSRLFRFYARHITTTVASSSSWLSNPTTSYTTPNTPPPTHPKTTTSGTVPPPPLLPTRSPGPLPPRSRPTRWKSDRRRRRR